MLVLCFYWKHRYFERRLIYLSCFSWIRFRAGTSNSLQYLIWLKSKTVKIYSVVQSVKLLLALSILIITLKYRWWAVWWLLCGGNGKRVGVHLRTVYIYWVLVSGCPCLVTLLQYTVELFHIRAWCTKPRPGGWSLWISTFWNEYKVLQSWFL